MTITLAEVAKLAGVSLATASRVVNRKPGVSAATQARVLQIIREQGYRPNSAARTLAAQRVRKTLDPK